MIIWRGWGLNAAERSMGAGEGEGLWGVTGERLSAQLASRSLGDFGKKSLLLASGVFLLFASLPLWPHFLFIYKHYSDKSVV